MSGARPTGSPSASSTSRPATSRGSTGWTAKPAGTGATGKPAQLLRIGQAVVVELRDSQDRPGQPGADHDLLGLEALDPDVVVRSNGAEAVRGVVAVAGRAFPFTRIAQLTLPALINGAAGVVTAADGDRSHSWRSRSPARRSLRSTLSTNPRRVAEADPAILGR
jgi:hypothetical protein